MATETAPETTTIAEPRPLESLSTNQLHDWRVSGKLPEETPKKDQSDATETGKSAESSAKPAAETDAAAPKQEPKPSKMGYGDLRKKLKEYEAEIERLKTSPREEGKREVAEPERPEPKAEKVRPRPIETDTDKDGKPKYNTIGEYFEDLADWKAEQKIAEFQQKQVKAAEEAKAQEYNASISKSWKERVDKARESHADIDEALDPKNGPAAEINGGSFLDRWILTSPQGAELLYHFHGDRDDLRRIGALPIEDASRELTKLELKLSGQTSAPPPKEEKKVTKAPPPAKDVGGRGTTATDEVRKAVADDDFTAFKNAQNRRELATHKR